MSALAWGCVLMLRRLPKPTAAPWINRHDASWRLLLLLLPACWQPAEGFITAPGVLRMMLLLLLG